MKKTFYILTASLAPVLALAASNVTDADSLIRTVGSILNAIIPIIIVLAVIYFLWGVLQYAFAGDEEKRGEARNIMIYGIIAIFVMVSVWGLVGILRGTFFGSATGGDQAPTSNTLPSVKIDRTVQ